MRNVPAPDVRLVQASLEERSLAEMLERVGKRFGVRVRCKRFDADTVRVVFAESRLRPYSLDETLDNLLRPLDLVWSLSLIHI